MLGSLYVFPQQESFANGLPNLSLATPEIKVSCKDYPGLINKIVKCVTNIVSYDVVEGYLDRIHSTFVQASNAAIVLYILFFGMKMMLGGIDNIRSEVSIVLLTSVIILYMNNTTRIMDTMNLFIRAQSEFANAATTAVTTSKLNTHAGQKLVCVGPSEVVNDELSPIPDPDDPTKNLKFNTWQRIDCIIAYIMGAHPLFESTAQYFDSNATEEDKGGDLSRYSYDMFATKDNPFANMAEDPYTFFDNDGAKVTENFETFLSFSLVTIASGMLLTESMGLVVVLTGSFIILLMMAAFGQAVLIYITSLFAIVVLGTFAPIILPLFLFRATRRVFDFWLQMLFTYTLQPGIMLCYLSFMLFVFQYVMNYSPNSEYNDGIGARSLIDYHYGKVFRDAEKGPVDVVKLSDETTSGYQEGSTSLKTQLSDLDSTVSDFEDRDTYKMPSTVGNQYEQENEGKRRTAERSNLVDTLLKTVTGRDTNLVGNNNVGLSVFSLKFDSSDDADVDKFVMDEFSDVANPVSPTSYHIGKFIRDKQDDPAFNRAVAEISGKKESEEFSHGIAYMQILLVIFLTMSVTLAFMQNVMAFGSEMAGAGTMPVSQMVNIYNSYTHKMAKSLN